MLPLVLGGLGAVGGALGAGALAGRYMPLLSKAAYEGADVLRSKASSGLRKTAQKVGATDFEGAGLGMLGTPARVLQERLSRAGAQVANIPLGKAVARNCSRCGHWCICSDRRSCPWCQLHLWVSLVN
jgi:hypothetical protein